MGIPEPPLRHNVIDPATGKMTIPWSIWFRDLQALINENTNKIDALENP